jgi:hypothetical protein
MPGYVYNVLSKFQQDASKHPQHTPSKYVMPVYGAKTQYATQDETPHLTAKQCLNIKKGTGSVLYYSREVDTTALMPLNDIATEQIKATEKTQAAVWAACSFVETNHHKRKLSMVQSTIWRQLSKIWSPQQLDQK